MDIFNKLENLIQLHETVEIDYLVDRYSVKLSYDGNDPTIEIEAETLKECFDILATYTKEQVRKMFWDGHRENKKFPIVKIIKVED